MNNDANETGHLMNGSAEIFSLEVMSKVFEESLAIQDEISALEEKQFSDKSENNNPNENVNICNQNEREPLEGNLQSCHRNPMQLGPVIKCILQYMDLKEIKNSRFISKEWSSIGLSAMTTISKIKIYMGDLESSAESVKGFYQVFPDTEDDIVPFTTIQICGCIDDKEKMEELNYFFRNQQKYMQDLEIRQIEFVDYWDDFDSIDITPWLSNSPITNQNTKCHTKLKIYDCDKFSVDSSALVHVKELDLRKCRVNIRDGFRFSPIDLKLIVVIFTRHENKVTELCINDIVDFSKAKVVYLGCHRRDSKRTLLSLNMAEMNNFFTFIDLWGITVNNWNKCNAAVDLLSLSNVRFVEWTPMQIMGLDFESSKIDPSILPQSLQELQIREVRQDTFQLQRLVVLDNLRSLYLCDITEDFFPVFSHGLRCPKLTVLKLESVFRMELDLSWIPKTIKFLELWGIKITNEENQMLRLQQLSFYFKYPIDETAICCNGIQTDVLGCKFPSPITMDKDVADVKFLNFLEQAKKYPNFVRHIYVGPFQWYGIPFEKSSLRNYLDTKADYYRFENMIGKAIDYKEFDSAMVIDKPKFLKLHRPYY